MPALSYHFGLRPVDIWELTSTQYNFYVDALAEIVKEGASNG